MFSTLIQQWESDGYKIIFSIHARRCTIYLSGGALPRNVFLFRFDILCLVVKRKIFARPLFGAFLVSSIHFAHAFVCICVLSSLAGERKTIWWLMALDNLFCLNTNHKIESPMCNSMLLLPTIGYVKNGLSVTICCNTCTVHVTIIPKKLLRLEQKSIFNCIQMSMRRDETWISLSFDDSSVALFWFRWVDVTFSQRCAVFASRISTETIAVIESLVLHVQPEFHLKSRNAATWTALAVWKRGNQHRNGLRTNATCIICWENVVVHKSPNLTQPIVSLLTMRVLWPFHL